MKMDIKNMVRDFASLGEAKKRSSVYVKAVSLLCAAIVALADRGVIYKCVFEKLHRVGIRDDGYNVLFTSILSIHDAGGVKRIRIYSRGDAIRTTPSYPENVTGFFFRNYTQEYELLDTSDGNKERN